MNPTGQKLCFTSVILLLVGMAYGLNYMSMYDQSEDVFGFVRRMQSGDTLQGPWRCNEQYAIMSEPVFYDHVIMSAPDFWRGSGYNPRFRGPDPTYDAPVLPLPTTATWHREQALASGFYFAPGPEFYARVELEVGWMLVAWCHEGVPCAEPVYQEIALPESAVVFFDCSVHLKGWVSTVLMLASSGNIGLLDNVLYATSSLPDGRTMPDHPEKLALIAEGGIAIMNTIENGRENCSGGGRFNPNQNQSSIAINGLLFALGTSFTFENQNDLDSGYVCACNPDERGYVHLTGGNVERVRGYAHRSTQGGTGYLKNYRYDEQLRFWDVNVFDVRENEPEPAAIEFGEIVVGEFVELPFHFYNEIVPVELTEISATAPFEFQRETTGLSFQHDMTVTVSADAPGEYSGFLTIHVPYYSKVFNIPLHAVVTELDARETPPLPRELSLSVYPNPFNAEATIRYSLVRAGDVRLSLYDVAGREVRVLLDEQRGAGEHVVHFNGEDFSTGVYFARLQTDTGVLTQKVLLVK